MGNLVIWVCHTGVFSIAVVIYIITYIYSKKSLQINHRSMENKVPRDGYTEENTHFLVSGTSNIEVEENT